MPSIFVDDTIPNAKLAADDGVEIFVIGQFSLMYIMVVGCRIIVVCFNAEPILHFHQG